MPRRTFLVALVIGLVVLVLSTTALARVVIRTSGQSWSPARVTVVRGTVVVWRATAGTHDVASWGRNWTFSQDLSGDPTAAKRFRTPGRFRFRCTFHSLVSAGVCHGMCGRVRVT